jgi:multidrug efflux pump subunit AcrA (membrane-fusion protein)
MITDERLQEIKSINNKLLEMKPNQGNYIFQELITALEAAQAEVVEANETMRSWKLLDETGHEWVKEVADLRAQLAEEQSKNGMLETLMSADKTIIKDALLLAESELAEAQAENERLQLERKNIGEAWNVIKR